MTFHSRIKAASSWRSSRDPIFSARSGSKCTLRTAAGCLGALNVLEDCKWPRRGMPFHRDRLPPRRPAQECESRTSDALRVVLDAGSFELAQDGPQPCLEHRRCPVQRQKRRSGACDPWSHCPAKHDQAQSGTGEPGCTRGSHPSKFRPSLPLRVCEERSHNPVKLTQTPTDDYVVYQHGSWLKTRQMVYAFKARSASGPHSKS